MKKLTALWLSLLLAFGTLTGCAGQIGIIGGEDGPTAIVTSDSASAVSVTEDGQYDRAERGNSQVDFLTYPPTTSRKSRRRHSAGRAARSSRMHPAARSAVTGSATTRAPCRTAAITSATSTPAEPTSAARNGWSTRTTAESTTPPTITEVLRKSQNSFYNNSISGEMRMKELLLDAETLYTREQLHDVLTKVCGFPGD